MIDSTTLKEQILQGISNRKSSSLRGVAERLGLSSTWLRKHIEKMRSQGLIKAWTLILNPWSLQQRIFFFLLKTNPNEPRVVAELLDNYPSDSLSLLEGITGDFSLIGRFHFPDATSFLHSLEHLYELIGETGFQKYQMIEVINIYKENGLSVPEIKPTLKENELKTLYSIQQLGKSLYLPPSSYDMAKHLNREQSSVYRQLKRWKTKNIILGYSIDTSYWQQYYIHTYIQVKAPLGKYNCVINFCQQDPNVINAYRTNQEYSLLLKTRHLTLSDLNEFLKSLYKYAEVEDTLTRIVLDNLRG
ncbi:MAG: Lrp/AsnC ligand binding domain-containing protein [Candidatus Hodarchaeota archaeon]